MSNNSHGNDYNIFKAIFFMNPRREVRIECEIRPGYWKMDVKGYNILLDLAGPLLYHCI